jgi:putative molybdopterin biosynthesis protein
MTQEMFTVKELAEYLDITENQVYILLRRKKLPGTKVTGKYLFPKEIIDEWIVSSARESADFSVLPGLHDNQAVISGSNDIALELLVKTASIQHPEYSYSISNIGSLAGLLALKKGNCHIAASHLLDPETGQYNSSYIRQHLPDIRVIAVNLAYREQGLMLRKGNPPDITTVKHLADRKISFINRQEGSGTRVLLDYQLKENGIAPEEIPGYTRIAYTHMEIAISVFSGSADAGMGIRAAAHALKLDFIPLATERFDLIIPGKDYSSAAVKALRGVLNSNEFKFKVAQLGGYDTRDTGRIVYEKG